MLRFFLTLLFLFTLTSQAHGEWSFELSGGAAYSFPTPLRFHQDGEKDISVNARYSGRPFVTAGEAPYYGWRIGRWKGDRAWELEWLHHKLSLSNRPDTVQRFEILNGFNLLMMNRALQYQGVIYRFGGGMVLTFPYSTVRAKEHSTEGGILDSGYYLSGVTLQVSAGKRFFFSEKVFLALEAKCTTSYARVPIEDGHADVTNAALHGSLGLGVLF